MKVRACAGMKGRVWDSPGCSFKGLVGDWWEACFKEKRVFFCKASWDFLRSALLWYFLCVCVCMLYVHGVRMRQSKEEWTQRSTLSKLSKSCVVQRLQPCHMFSATNLIGHMRICATRCVNSNHKAAITLHKIEGIQRRLPKATQVSNLSAKLSSAVLVVVALKIKVKRTFSETFKEWEKSLVHFLRLLHFSGLTKKINGGSETLPAGVTFKDLNPRNCLNHIKK